MNPGTYRGVLCFKLLGKISFVSFCTKTFLTTRLRKKSLHPSQISFLSENRTSDHVFTILTLIDKHANCHKGKVYLYFVDFKKAFDSVWHEGLLYRIVNYGIGGHVYNLIKNLYSCKSTSAGKLNIKETESFDYSRVGRQVCVLSPMLFNLFVNELPLSFDQCLKDPITLPIGTKLNNLFYADDLSSYSFSECITVYLFYMAFRSKFKKNVKLWFFTFFH